jgi:hypothetical protein
MRDRSRCDDDLRNYFVPVASGIGQTADRQLDGFAAVGEALSGAVGGPITDMRCAVAKA